MKKKIKRKRRKSKERRDKKAVLSGKENEKRNRGKKEIEKKLLSDWLWGLIPPPSPLPNASVGSKNLIRIFFGF